MSNLARLSIKAQIVAIAVGTAVLSLMLTSVTHMTNELLDRRRGLAVSSTTLTRVIGVNSEAALAFQDPETGGEILGALTSEPEVIAAQLLSADGSLLAEYRSQQPRHRRVLDEVSQDLARYREAVGVANEGTSHRFLDEYLQVVHPITLNEKLLGVIAVQVGLDELRAGIWRAVTIAALVLVIAVAVAYLLAVRLQRLISDPITKLAVAAKTVAEEGDYSIRVTKPQGRNEVATLMNGFNVMLDQIQQRDEQLGKSKEKAELASRVKSEFVANVSHEIRTPMNGVLGMAEVLLNTSLQEKQRRFVETISRSGQSLLTIINDILDFSKIEAGKLELECLDFNLRENVEDCAEMLAEKAHRKGLELNCWISEQVPKHLRGDPGRIRQVLINLLGNAIRFTGSGEVSVSASVVESSEDGTLVRLEVQDTGIGIENEEKDRIFDSFSQADSSTTRRYGGTGLGLAIARQLVALMGGEIGVVSEAGEGSNFWFTARLGSSRATDEDAHRSRHLRGKHVLVVDDNETNRTILREQLTGWGMLCGLAEAADEALALVRTRAERGQPFDVALLDMNMPEKDGLALAREIKDDRRLSALPMIMLSSVHDIREEDREGTGILTYLSKPTRQEELRTALESVLDDADGGESEALAKPLVSLSQKFSGRVLLAEDNLVNQLVAIEMLQFFGCEADVVPDGEQALEAIARNHYDVVFMDCQMPNMDGYEATRRVRQQEQAGRRIPIIALTANVLAGDMERCLREGMDDYLGKPFEQKDLAAALARWLPGSAGEPMSESTRRNDST